MPLTLKGIIFSGVMRGKPLVEKYYHRAVGILGFEPYKGTMDIKLEKKIDIRPYAEKTLEHILLNGTRKIDAYFARVKVKFSKIKEKEYDCWAMRQMNGVYEDDVVELIGKDCFKEKLDLKDGDEVEITFFERPLKKRKRFSISKILKHETQLMKI
jgi:riboflavin kinase